MWRVLVNGLSYETLSGLRGFMVDVKGFTSKEAGYVVFSSATRHCPEYVKPPLNMADIWEGARGSG